MVTMHRARLAARFDARRTATLDELVPLVYARPAEGLPPHVRAASGLRRFNDRLVVVQDDVNALAVGDGRGTARAVLLPADAAGRRVFDDTLGNKRDKLDLEACATLPDGRFVAFGSGALPQRERLVVWDGLKPLRVVAAPELYAELRAAVARGAARLNVEGAAVRGSRLELFHRGNDVRAGPPNAIAELGVGALAAWLDGGAPVPRVARLTAVELGHERGVPYGFTDAVALDDERVIVLACAEDAADALSDGPVLGCRVGLLDARGLRVADVCDSSGARTPLKLEGIERRPGSSIEFDVAVDVDRLAAPALLGRLVWEWQ